MNKSGSRKALGRGLSNLIPVNLEEASEESNNIHFVSISSIKTNPFQPRLDFDMEEIVRLAESIDKQGLLQPIVVRKKESLFEIISGERRFRAFQHLKKDSVPCIIKQGVSDREMLELALIENIQREELNEIEKAVAYQKLLLEYDYTHEKLSEQIGKSRTAITNAIRLLNLPEEIQVLVRKNQITMGHARALLSFNEHDQKLLAQRIINEELSVRDVEKLNTENKKRKKVKVEKASEIFDPDTQALIDKLQYRYGTSISISDIAKEKGRLSLMFFGKKDLNRIVDLLLQ